MRKKSEQSLWQRALHTGGRSGRKTAQRVLSFVLSAAMLTSSFGMTGYAIDAAAPAAGGSYTDYTEDSVVASLAFGSNVTPESIYDEAAGCGFKDIEYNAPAADWQGSVYIPRAATKDEAGASYVKAADGALEIQSRVWTETESTGYGVYTYENTSSFDMALDNADYNVEVTFVNPTAAAYTAYLKNGAITKVSDIEVAAGASVTKSFTAVVIDGMLRLRMLAGSSATSAETAAVQSVYVSAVRVTRLATQSAGAKPTVFLASDSTVQTYDDYYDPQTGWGETLANFFGANLRQYECTECGYSQSETYETDNVIVQNRAIGGRSSASFVTEGKLDDLLEDVKPGDFVFVQWGHNDATANRPNRYVAPEAFQGWLMCYVNGALQRGATPVLVTPVARYSYTTNADGTLESFASNFEAYRQVMLSMSAELGIPCVDLTARSIAVCNSFGIDGAESLFLHVPAGEYVGAYAGGATDSTHLQYYGAYKFAQCVAQGILDCEDSRLDTLKSGIVMTVPENEPAKVEGLNATSIGATSASFAWSAAEGSEMYYIYRAALAEGQTAADVDFSAAEKYSVATGTSYTDKYCVAGKTYVYAVRGFNDKGLGELSDLVTVSTKSAGYRFDFNSYLKDKTPSSGPSVTMEGWTGINLDTMYTAENGMGWITSPNNGRNRTGTGNADSSAMADDCTIGAGEFAVDVPNGDYEVTIYAGDLLSGTSTTKSNYTGEGVAIGGISVKQAIGSMTNTVRVTDGTLNIGVDNYMNGMTLTELLLAPSGLAYSELDLNQTTLTGTFLLGFNSVKEAVSYNVYGKGSSDARFSVVKSFTAADLAGEKELECRAMSGTLGESYEFYVTCVTADEKESAPSNVVAVSLVGDGTKGVAPTGLVCTAPVAGETELKSEISLGWNAVSDAIKYVVYRSEKAESDKGFTGFAKVGEATTNAYTDRAVPTNIHYYYKVATVNINGLGAMSEETLVTPITGVLSSNNLETYTDRALVAINLAGGDGAEVNVSATDAQGNALTSGVYLSWRSFADDLDGDNNVITTFDVYRNGTLIAENLKLTNAVDAAGTAADTYKVVGSNDAALGLTALETAVWANKYLELSLYKPADQTMPDGAVCTFSANDMSVGDLDGDGQLELIVKWYPSNAKDNSGAGYTGTTILDAYDVNFATGAVKLLWRMDLGVNIRSGAHYTQFQVWDFDGDGKSEIAVKTADGTTVYKSEDGTDATLTETGHVGVCSASALPTATVSAQNDYRNASGYVLSGPEYFTMFNGEDGSMIDTMDYIPERGSVNAWGDSYGNRVDRFLSATAYLDGTNPYAVFCRGYYTRTCLTAYYLKDTDGNGIGDTLDTLWKFDTNDAGSQFEAQGNHGLSVNDVDNDGKDEIIYGSLVIDNDGTVLYSTGLGHGDAMHVSDWVSWNPGLEIMDVHEHDNAAYHVEIHDAETGKILMGYYTGKDTGRGVAADIDPTAEGAEWWSIASPTYESNDEPSWDSTNGEVYSSWSTLDNLIKLSNSTPASNFSIFWDGDLLSEIQDHTFNSVAYAPLGTVVSKWNYETQTQDRLLYSTEIWSNNGTKGNMGLVADVLGDWREEIITRTSADASKVRVYSTTIQTDYVIPCLLENLAYREGVAWQNVGYNQPANLSYLISQGLVSAQLSEGEMTSSSATVKFSAANDGDLYGHEITAYEIYRAVGEGEFVLLDTVSEADLEKVKADGAAPEQTGWKDAAVVGTYDFGNKSSADGFTLITNDAYTATKGYGFTSTNEVTYNKVGVGIAPAGETATALEKACSDLSRASNELTFAMDVAAGTYRVSVYAGAAYSNSAYNNTKISVNGTDLGTVSQAATVADIEKSTVVTLDTDGQITVTSANPGSGKLAILNAIVLTKLEPVYAEVDVDTDAWLYSYTDRTTASNTGYRYEVAAVVDGKTSYKSLPLSVKTAVAVKSVDAITLADLVENTPLAEGETVADLLPATVSVVDEYDAKQSARVEWDVSAVNLAAPDTYTVVAHVEGYAPPIEVSLTIVANALKCIQAVEDITVQAGNAPTLPATVVLEYTNTTTEEKAVVWNTESLDITVPGDYTLSGTVEGVTPTASVVVHVRADYIVSTAKAYAEVALNSTDPAASLPATVTATYFSGKTELVNVTWDVSTLNVSEVGKQNITGAIADYTGTAAAEVSVVYPVYKRFDFGINASEVNSDWIGVTVNPKGGNKTCDTLGITYTADKGYGFLNADAQIQGRSEGYTQDGILPNNVYKDFVLPDGQIFEVDVPNGSYVVDLVTGSAYKSTLKASIEGTVAVSGSNAVNSYGIYSYNVEVTDGKMTVEFTSGTTNRVDALVIRQVVAATEKASVTVCADAYPLTVNGEAKNDAFTGAFELGETVTVVAENSENAQYFDCWASENGTVLSHDASYTFTVGAPVTVKAVYKIPVENKSFVDWQSAYGQTVKSGQYGAEEITDSEFPAIPFRMGYTATEWTMTAQQISDAIEAGDAEIVVTPNYVKDAVTYTVAVTNGTGSGSYEANAVVTVTASAAPDGEKFSHWADAENADGRALSYNASYKFYAAADITLTAVYVEEETVVEAMGTAEIATVTPNSTTGKLSFSAMLTVPTGCKIVYAGVVATSNAAKSENLTAANADYVRGDAASSYSAYRYTWTKGNVGNNTWYVRAYLVYTNAAGETVTVYGDVVSASLNG